VLKEARQFWRQHGWRRLDQHASCRDDRSVRRQEISAVRASWSHPRAKSSHEALDPCCRVAHAWGTPERRHHPRSRYSCKIQRQRDWVSDPINRVWTRTYANLVRQLASSRGVAGNLPKNIRKLEREREQ